MFCFALVDACLMFYWFFLVLRETIIHSPVFFMVEMTNELQYHTLLSESL